MLDIFWLEAGLKRSIDKVYEIIVYGLFSVLVEELNISVELSLDSSRLEILEEFEHFAQSVLRLDSKHSSFKIPARLYRGGATNTADRGLDMWANFGPAIQIKHLTLNEELTEDVVESISADRIVIVCRSAEKGVIISLLNQIGWKSRIQSIITEDDLVNWYEKALRGKYASALSTKLLNSIIKEIQNEFPSADNLHEFLTKRGYEVIRDDFWTVE